MQRRHTFAELGLHHDVVFIDPGKLGMPENALLAMAMGCDMVNVARTDLQTVQVDDLFEYQPGWGIPAPPTSRRSPHSWPADPAMSSPVAAGARGAPRRL